MKGEKMADSLQTLKCPACGKDMEKVFITNQGISLDICTQGCGGIYFDNREFNKFDEQDEDISAVLEKINSSSFQKVNETMDRFCPNCGSKMVKNHSSIHQTIQIDECYNCGGKFLDNSELVKIRAEYENNDQRDEDILRHVYKTAGQELAALDQKYADSKTDRTILQKVFYKLTGI